MISRGTIIFLGLWSVACLGADIQSQDPGFDALVPPVAYSGVGVWETTQFFIACGHSSSVDVLQPAANIRVETDDAIEDAKQRIACKAAADEIPDFQESFYDLSSEMSGLKIAATYTLPPKEDFFVVGIVDKNNVKVKPMFNAAKARAFTINEFNQGNFSAAARDFALLNKLGLQDEEVLVYAQAASCQVDLAAGLVGDAREGALRSLVAFYLAHHDDEHALQNLYSIYLATDRPDDRMLEQLIDLCDRTHRASSAEKFRQELQRRGVNTAKSVSAATQPASVRFAHVYNAALAAVAARDVDLMAQGGAALIKSEGKQYFVAVGITDVRGDSVDESLREVRVAISDARREAAAFCDQTDVTVQEEFNEDETIIKDGHLTFGSDRITAEEMVRSRIDSQIANLVQVASGKTKDGKSYIYVLGCAVD